jgi:2-phospho-L-lactate/phosphoenolpyruvate guanylyltransferase
MRTLAVVPIKTLSAAKQRLSGSLAGGARASLMQAMFSDVLGSLRHTPSIDAIAVVTADVIADALGRGDGATVLHDIEQTGQSAATMIGIRYAVESGFDRVVLVPGDTPLVDAVELEALLGRAEDGRFGVVIVSDRHGTGTNALVLSPPDAMEPSFGEGSFDRHVALAESAGVSWTSEAAPSLEHDIDTPDDLAALARALDGARTVAPRTRGALRQLQRSGAIRDAADLVRV